MQDSRHAIERSQERRVPQIAVNAARLYGRKRQVSDADHYVLRRCDIARLPRDNRRQLEPWTGLIVIVANGTVITQFTNPRPGRYLDRKRLRNSLHSKRKQPRRG